MRAQRRVGFLLRHDFFSDDHRLCISAPRERVAERYSGGDLAFVHREGRP